MTSCPFRLPRLAETRMTTPAKFLAAARTMDGPPMSIISTISAGGVRNLAPYSYFNLMGSDPFYVAFGSTAVKDTLANVREVPQFVANIVTMDLLEKMNFTSADFPRQEDEFGWAGLTPVPAAKSA